MNAKTSDKITSKVVCPDLPETQQTTCTPSWCGGETCDITCTATSCGVTCSGTCIGPTCGTTCVNTCQSTCASTCASTCLGGSCYNFSGVVSWWDNLYGGGSGNDWKWSIPQEILDVYYWCWTGQYGGEVSVKFGSGGYYYLTHFEETNGSYNGTTAGPSGQLSFAVKATSRIGFSPWNDCIPSEYYPEWTVSGETTVGHGPSAYNSVNVTVPMFP